MCDQSKSIATSFMCGKDLDNYLKNQYYAGPFTQGTRMLNKYRTQNTNQCIDHYENLQFDGCCDAIKGCEAKKKSSCKKQPQPKQKSNSCGNYKPPPSPSLSSYDSDMGSCGPPPAPSCPPPPKPCVCCRPSKAEPNPCCNTEKNLEQGEKEDPVSKRCKELFNRGKTLLTQIEHTKLPTIIVEDDEYLPSITGSGWQIATKPKILGKSKFQIKAFDPYLMLHLWQENQEIDTTHQDNKSLRAGAESVKNDETENEGPSEEEEEKSELVAFPVLNPL